MRWGDVVPALLMLVLSAAVFVETRGLEFFDGIPGPAFMPLWLAIAGVVLFILRLLEARRLPAGSGIDWPDRGGLQRVLLTLAGLVAIPLIAPVLGLMAAIVLFMAFLLIVVLGQRVGPSLATVAITASAVYGIFVLWLGLALPKGVLGL
jgi:hypothetical protein